MSIDACMPFVFKGQEIVLTKGELLRIESRIDTSGDCWEWTGFRKNSGYGQCHIKRNTVLAHRAVWMIFNGTIPDNLLVCHTCDNPPCCNPKHLFLGTYLDNNRDRDSKGRNGLKGMKRNNWWMMGELSHWHKHPKNTQGENNGKHKLDSASIHVIRFRINQGDRISDISAHYHVSDSCIQKIKERRTWAHIQ